MGGCIRGLSLPKQSFVALDGLRGVAALSVVMLHWFGSSRSLFAHSYLAVDFFFMLSGFVLAYAYEDRLAAGLSFRAFAIKRLVRLYPLVLAGTLTGLAASLAVAHLRPRAPVEAQVMMAAVARALVFLPTLKASPVGYGVFPLDHPTWSLFFELAVNLAFALHLTLSRRRLSLAALLLIAALSGGFLLRAAALHRGVEVGFKPEHFLGGLPRTIFPFVIGVALYRLHRPGERKVESGWAVLALALALTALFLTPTRGPWAALMDLGCITLVFPALIMAGARMAPVGLAQRLCRWSGDLSYPVYILHAPILLGVGLLAAAHPSVADLRRLAGVAALATIAAAWTALKFYDEPVRRRLNRLAPG